MTINEGSIRKHWEDILLVAVSLKLGHVSASDLIRSLFRKNRPSGLAKTLMNLDCIIKTLYLLNYIDNEEYRHHILTQLNNVTISREPYIMAAVVKFMQNIGKNKKIN